MRINSHHSVKDWLMAEICKAGEITSITNMAIRNNITPFTLWLASMQLEAEGKINITRNGRHPATLRPNSTYHAVQECGLCFQLELFR